VDDAPGISPISPEIVVIELPLCHDTDSGTTFGLAYSQLLELRKIEARPKVRIPLDGRRFVVSSLNSQKHIDTRQNYSLSVFKCHPTYRVFRTPSCEPQMKQAYDNR